MSIRLTHLAALYALCLGASPLLANEAKEPYQVRIVLDVGNLLDAGHSPVAFVGAVGALLHADVHLKDPVTREANAGEELCAALSRSAPIRCVLVENDYRAAPERLAMDLVTVRDLGVGAWS